MADDRQPRGGPRTIILVLAAAALLAIGFAVFGRRSGEGKKEVTSTTLGIGHAVRRG